MKIIFTGGGSGGHFYPIIAVSRALALLLRKEGLTDIQMYYISNTPYNKKLLEQNHLIFKQNKTGKLRIYFSPLNIFDAILTFFATIRAFFQLFFIYPDVVFSKGAYPSFPVTTAAWLLKIPVIIHESDSAPGRANKFASKFAKRIAISYAESSSYFPPEKIALTGNPIRSELLELPQKNVNEVFGLTDNAPIIFITGGSQGAQTINDIMISAGPKLIESYQIIHQVGQKNYINFQATMDVILQQNQYKNRYKIFPYLDTNQMNTAGRSASLIISRGGSSIFEIAIWGVPSIIIPISETNGDHQCKNAYAYARIGACHVINENNLTPHIFLTEINRICNNKETVTQMKKATQLFAKTDAAKKIAIEILGVLKEHLPTKTESTRNMK